MTSPYSSRRQRLRRRFAKLAPAMLVTGELNVSYLTGFSGDSSWLLLTADRELLISDFRYRIQLEEECPGLETVIRGTRVPIHEAAGELIRQLALKSVAIESHLLTLETHRQIQAAAGCELVEASGLVEQLRTVKDAGEIAEIREAVALAARGFNYLQAVLGPEMTERELAYELEHAMRRFGAAGVAFPPIIAVGDRGALPHYRPGTIKIREADTLLVDWGAQTHRGYKSDLTRTLVTGKKSKKFEQIYAIVLEAQLRAIAQIRPGALCNEVDAAARDFITQSGYGKQFDHGLGHGIGLFIHEQPRLSPVSTQTLEPGMVVTVEPGIYVPGWGGIRIEDDVLVTRDGCEVLSAVVPK